MPCRSTDKTGTRSAGARFQLAAQELEDSISIMEASESIRDVVSEYCDRFPAKSKEARQMWGRVVRRVLYEDREGKETMRRPRKGSKPKAAPQEDKISLPEAMSAVAKVVAERLNDQGWDEPLEPEWAEWIDLAWQRLQLRCHYQDSNSLKRIEEAAARGKQ